MVGGYSGTAVPRGSVEPWCGIDRREEDRRGEAGGTLGSPNPPKREAEHTVDVTAVAGVQRSRVVSHPGGERLIGGSSTSSWIVIEAARETGNRPTDPHGHTHDLRARSRQS
jgi:hypothetical protein